MGEISAASTSDNQWKFLYKLAEKVFNYLKTNQKTDNKTEVIEWLTHKLQKTSNESEDWKKFKDLCTQQLKEEPKPTQDALFLVHKPESRLCFLGKRISDKNKDSLNISIKSAGAEYGTLNNWSENDNSIYEDLDFMNWTKSNLDLWENFKSLGENYESQVDEKFDEWYEQVVITVIVDTPKKLKDLLENKK